MGTGPSMFLRPFEFLVDLHRRHGDAFRVAILGGPVTFVVGEAARQHLEETSRCPLRRSGLYNPFAREVGLAVFDAEGEAHRRARALLREPYSRALVLEHRAAIASQVEAALVDLREPADLLALTLSLAQRAAMRVITQVPLERHAAAVSTAGNRVMYAQFKILPEFVLRLPKYRRAHKEMMTAIEAAVRAHEAHPPAQRHMIDVCLSARLDDGTSMDRRTLIATCVYALAGTEIYVGRILYFLLEALLEHPEWLARLRAELDDAADDGERPIFRAVLNETLRRRPLIPTYLYEATDDFALGDLSVRRGERVGFSPYLSHFDERVFPDPLRFDPSRFLDDDRRAAARATITPFGWGDHACVAPGMVEAYVEAIVQPMLQRWDVSIHRRAAPQLRMMPLIRPRRPMTVTTARRSAA